MTTTTPPIEPASMPSLMNVIDMLSSSRTLFIVLTMLAIAYTVKMSIDAYANANHAIRSYRFHRANIRHWKGLSDLQRGVVAHLWANQYDAENENKIVSFMQNVEARFPEDETTGKTMTTTSEDEGYA